MKLTLVTPADWYCKSSGRPARLIQRDGTTVGYLHEGDDYRGEHVRAIGDDPDIQEILNEWYSEYAAERKAKARQSAARLELEINQRRERERAEARKALKL